MENAENTNLLKVKDVAEYLNVSESTIRQWVGERKIPFVKLIGKRPGTVRFTIKMINEWIEMRKVAINNQEEINTAKLIELSKSNLPESSKKILEEFEDFLKHVKEKSK